MKNFKCQIQIITDESQSMQALTKFNLRLSNENLQPISMNLDGSLSQRSQNNLIDRSKGNKITSCVFRKRNNTAISGLTQIAQKYETFSSNQLRGQLEKKQKYLQSLIEEIVQSEQAHKIQMISIDERYEAQIQQMHQQLQSLVQRNRILRNGIAEKEKNVLEKKQRSPRISNQTLLLDCQQISSFDVQ